MDNFVTMHGANNMKLVSTKLRILIFNVSDMRQKSGVFQHLPAVCPPILLILIG